jgi:hypothetical protein
VEEKTPNQEDSSGLRCCAARTNFEHHVYLLILDNRIPNGSAHLTYLASTMVFIYGNNLSTSACSRAHFYRRLVFQGSTLYFVRFNLVAS